MEPKQIDLYEFLVESELQQYYNSIKNELKISNASHLKYASDEDLKQIGLSRPEIRRLRKFYEKYYPHGYLSKIKRLLQNPKRDDIFVSSQMASSEPVKTASSPGKAPSNKHIIPADSICVNKQLGTGEFGIVQQGVWTNGAERIQVAIKCLCRERMQSNPMEFLKEAAIMHAIEHENIVRLYGVVLDTDSLMLVTELAHLRSLLECLKDSGLRVSFLTVPTLCEFAMQICNGMMYLENKRLIHRDLAARNILVFSKNKVKISDFGLSRALGVGKDYYKTNFNVNLKLPIAWCAPECINYLRFTNASDVWAYGVCLWEMFSYGFQPWAALTGIQILEAIDEPNYQRLEQPECCPREYYTLMLKCWQHDPSKRPKFSDIYTLLPEMKPEQLKTIVSNCEPKKDHLMYRQGEIVTVLDKATNSPYWKGVLNSGKTGLFNPANTVAYVEGLPTTANRESFCRTADRSSKRKLRSEMISMPQNDLKHTGHVGLDGAYFGDVAFMAANSQNYNPPRQIVTPYKPSEDIEQTPLLLPPTPTSPDSLQTASGYFPETIATSSTNPSFVNSNENTPKHQTNAFGSSFDFPPQTIFNSSNPFASNTTTDPQQSGISLQNNNYGLEANAFTNANLEDDSLQDSSQKNTKWSESDTEPQHEYHEISDDEITAEKVFDLGPSLLDEINSMFGSISTTTVDPAPKSPDFEHTNKKNEITELTSKLNRKNSGDGSSKSKKKSTGIVKQISVKDEKILNQAIEIANEISARSMTDLVADTPTSAQSPKRKFSFRFPNLSHHSSTEKDNTTPSSGHFNGHTNTLSHSKERKNFSEELKNIPDLQNSITEEGREAYNSLIEKKTSPIMGDFDVIKDKCDATEFKLLSAKTLPRKLTANGGSVSKLVLDLNDNATGITPSAVAIETTKDLEFAMPTQQAPRPTTLPNRSMNKIRKQDMSDSSPLRILRDKNYPIVRPRIKTVSTTDNEENTNPNRLNMDGNERDSNCESPSYLMNTSYTFPDSSGGSKSKSSSDNSNPIPLPPRDRNKIMQTNAKRHVRKHPLIIPASGVQRTLNKVTEVSTVDDLPRVSFNGMQAERLSHISNNSFKINLIKTSENNSNEQFKRSKKSSPQTATVKPNHLDIKMKLTDESHTHRTYENVEDLQLSLNENQTDSASLHFESILEDDFNKVDVVSSPDVVDGFCPFAIQKDLYNKFKEVDFENTKISGLYVNEDELRNLDIERKRVEFVQKHPKYCEPKNELADNALFNKIRETVDSALSENREVKSKSPEIARNVSSNNVNNNNESPSAQNNNEEEDQDEEKIIEMRLKDANSVSCEDLLEFSDRKPKGSECGVDSDEVRIMLKVLGKDASPQRCLNALEFIEWDVHKAIKLIKLQNILSVELSFEESIEALQKYDWDLQVTALKLKGFN